MLLAFFINVAKDKKEKRGAEISISILVVFAIALIVLVLVALLFMGKMEWLIGKKSEVTKTVLSEAEKNLALQKCKLYCSLGNKDGYENPGFSQKVIDAGFTKCSDFDELGPFEEECLTKECYGTPSSCEERSEADCKFGCSWDIDAGECKGSPYACSSMTNEDDCRANGCTWGVRG